jgi:hypothetical protein
VPGQVRTVKERLLTWWYMPAPAARLALLRIAFGCFATYYLITRLRPLSNVATLQDWEFAPVGLVWFLARPLPAAVVLGSGVVAIALAAAFAVGFRYRFVAPAFALLLLWITSYRNSWGMLYHTDNLLVFHALLLAVAPAADALSLDARRWRQQGRPAATDGEDGRYGWVIRALCVVTVTAYLIAGVAKLKLGGLAWAGGEQLRAQVAFDNLRKVMLGREASNIGVWLVRQPALFAPLAVLTLLIELGAPLALAHRRVALAWTLGAWAFHKGVELTMHITFAYPLAFVPFLPFFPLERALPALHALRRLRLSSAREHDRQALGTIVHPDQEHAERR